MRSLLVAIGFLTRIPVPGQVYGEPTSAARSLIWYPLVGALLGAVLLGVYSLLADVPALIRAAVALTVWAALTGGLHLDGLADSADAWIGGLGDRQRTLTIMKDPRSGPAGVTAIVLDLLIKFAALASLSHAWALILVLALGRAAAAALLLTTPYVRAAGLGAALQDAPRAACWAAIALCVVVCLTTGNLGLRAVVATAIVWLAWRAALLQRLGGCTGDTAGALIEMAEAGALIALVAA
ncbi:MAG TPA: adenosylcobinamide-GDP ribazoletransferase [Nevskiaceae bacterium]|nr:adenosylcobinamide-GDP ribazoletransferase [Nevskiaceae bacterium]